VESCHPKEAGCGGRGVRRRGLLADRNQCPTSEAGAGLVGQARVQFPASGAGGNLDLDQARREAADRVVVSKVRQSLEHLERQSGGLGSQ
jgi:hypothetical protein